MSNTQRPAAVGVSSPRDTTLSSPHPSQARGPESWGDDEIDLSRYKRPLRERWQLVVAGAIVGAVLGLASALRQPVSYEASTTLLIDRASSPAAVATTRALLQNYSLAEQTVNEIGLNRPPDPMTAQQFVDNALQIEEVRGTNLVKVKVRLADPGRASEASRLMARKAVTLNRQVTSEGATALRSQLKVLVDEAAERLRLAEQQYVSYQDQAQVEVLKRDTESMLDERGSLLHLVIDIERERASLKAAEEELQKQPPLLTSPRSVNTEDALRRVLQQQATVDAPARRPPADRPGAEAESQRLGGTAESPQSRGTKYPTDSASQSATAASRQQSSAPAVEGSRPAPPRPVREQGVDPQLLDLSNPFVNPVYQTLAFQVATSRARLAALERERQEMVAVRKLGDSRFRELSDLYRRQIDVARLRDSYDRAKQVYNDVALRYEESRTQSLGDAAQLQIVDNAIPPDRPLPRGRLQQVGLGATAGVLLAALLALALGNRDPKT